MNPALVRLADAVKKLMSAFMNHVYLSLLHL
jgi:hypothetical protein